MSHSTNRNAPWNDWDEARHGRGDDVLEGYVDEAASSPQDAQLYEMLSRGPHDAGEEENEVNESRDDTVQDQSRPAHERGDGE